MVGIMQVNIIAKTIRILLYENQDPLPVFLIGMG